MNSELNEKRPQQQPVPIGLVMMCLAFIAFCAVIGGMIYFLDQHWRHFYNWIDEWTPIVFWVLVGFALLGGIAMFTSTRDLNFVTPFNRVAWYQKKKEREKEKIRRGRSDEELLPWELQVLQKIENFYNDKVEKRYEDSSTMDKLKALFKRSPR
jgi:hypothetical protein